MHIDATGALHNRVTLTSAETDLNAKIKRRWRVTSVPDWYTDALVREMLVPSMFDTITITRQAKTGKSMQTVTLDGVNPRGVESFGLDLNVDGETFCVRAWTGHIQSTTTNPDVEDWCCCARG